MERFRNQWHLYEWLKREYMRTGLVPNDDQARAEFPELNLEEMGEGYLEFQIMIAKYEKGA